MVRDPSNARLVVEPIETSVDPEAVLVLTAGRREPAVLETLQPARVCGRFSMFASDPVETVSLAETDSVAPWALIRRLTERVPAAARSDLTSSRVPLAGGWIGYLSYEGGLIGARVPPRPAGVGSVPLMRFGLYDHLLTFDHAESRWYACAVDWADGRRTERPSAAERIDHLRRRVVDAGRTVPPSLRPPTKCAVTVEMSSADYRRAVRRAIEYIEAGDIYQVNLSRRFSARTDAAPLELYRRLRRTNPSSHAAYLRWGDTAVISSSPELFLDLRDGVVATRPIKGTRRRWGDVVLDEAARADLESSGKDRAELTMIVDLLRNDLGKVCEFGSIRVTNPGEIERHPTVFHRVATIEGRPRSDVGASELLEATFPGGSVTGAPKLRAMQIIRELEPVPREVYCGSIGWIGLDGRCSFNIAIRTMLQRGDLVHAHAGGAIMAESDPDAEEDEIRAKAEGLFAAIGASDERAAAVRRVVREIAPA